MDADAVRVRVLGQVEVRDGDRMISIRAGRQREILAVLALDADRVVPVPVLIDKVWGPDASDKAVATLHAHVARLRQSLGTQQRRDVLITEPPGYALRVRPERVDLHEARSLATSGRRALAASELRDASALLRQALDRWGDQPLADVRGAYFADRFAALLVEERLSVLEDLVEAELRLGRERQILTELSAACHMHPLRERLAGQRMLALYRLGRQSDALALYDGVRRLLREELGADPSPALERIHVSVLNHDVSLEPTPVGPAPTLAVPATKYTRNGDVHLAYQTFGAGPEFVGIPPFAQNVELLWEDTSARRFLHRLASFSRFTHFDKRGTGMSDRGVGVSQVAERVEDLKAVMDAAGVTRAVIGGVSEGGPTAVLFAVRYPERCTGLVLFGTAPRFVAADDLPWNPSLEDWVNFGESWAEVWGSPKSPTVALMSPPRVVEAGYLQWMERYERQSLSRGALATLMRMNAELDVRRLLPQVRVPTLVLHRREDRVVNWRNARYLAERIPGARLEILKGDEHHPWAGDADTLVDRIEDFLHAVTSADRGRDT